MIGMCIFARTGSMLESLQAWWMWMATRNGSSSPHFQHQRAPARSL